MVWASLVSAPLDEETIAQARHHFQNRHGIVIAQSAAVVVVGDIQALMQTALFPNGRTGRSTAVSDRRPQRRNWWH